ncbi:MAG: hypothetical protein U0324_37090 [Polyangiales bacterium]
MPKGSRKKPQKKHTTAHDDALLGENEHAKATPSGHPTAGPDVEETVTVGDVTLEQTPMRLMLLLRGVGTIKAVREVLRPLGVHGGGARAGLDAAPPLFGLSRRWRRRTRPAWAAPSRRSTWDEPTFTIAEAALRHRHLPSARSCSAT